jgi:beta-glucosidase
MPWRDNVKGILASWYPGIGGAQAMTNLIFGDVNPSGKLPLTFTKSDADLPHPQVTGLTPKSKDTVGTDDGGSKIKQSFDVNYTEGVRFGYKWFDSEKKEPMYPFGFGLSYTTFAYSGLKTDASGRSVTFTVKNTGQRAGDEIAQVYVELPTAAGENFKRLAGFQRIPLAAGESRSVTIALDPLTMSVFDVAKDAWTMPKGSFRVLVGPSSRETPLVATMAE